MKRLFCLAVLMLSLPGCVPAVFVAGTAAGAMIASDRRDLQTMTADQNIAQQISQKIIAARNLPEQKHIEVTSFNRVVLLTGQIPTAATRARVEQIAQSIPRIRRLYNYLTVAKPTSAGTRSQDALITTNLKTRLLTTADLHDSQLKIVTENGTVYLMGFTTPSQANIAVATARQSKGVKRVVKLVEMIKR